MCEGTASDSKDRRMTDYSAPVEADLMTGLGKIVAGWAHVDQCMGEFLAF